MNKPIGILTFHRASNYGAVLQAYALQTVLSGISGNAEIVDYYCSAVEDDHRPIGLFKHHKVHKAILHLPLKAKKDMVFNAFRKRKLVTSEPYRKKNIAAAADRYAVFVAGSDQVWNDRLSGMDPAYMMDFAREEQRYSYACSFGFDQFPKGRERTYVKYLSAIRRISLRESSGVDMLANYGLQAQTDLDPTLLLAAEEWKAFCKVPNRKEPYILVYTVSPDVHLLEYARKLSERTGCPILNLNNQMRTNRDLTRIRFATPEKFVGLFAGAQYVLTNSFHGTAFSLIFHKKLKVELETKKKFNVRSRDLLQNCALDGCILKNDESDDLFEQDWDRADALLNAMREKSLDYLREIASAAEANDAG